MKNRYRRVGHRAGGPKRALFHTLEIVMKAGAVSCPTRICVKIGELHSYMSAYGDKPRPYEDADNLIAFGLIFHRSRFGGM
jgi:hypothetical protein